MAGYVEWTEPVAVRQWRWQTKELPKIKSIFSMFGKWTALLGIPALLVLARFAPSELPRIALCLPLLAVFLPLSASVTSWIDRKNCTHYSVEEKGLRRHAGTGTTLYPWQDVERYQITEHPDLSGVGVLKLKFKHRHKAREWSFNTAQLNEQELRRAIERHLSFSSLHS